MSAPEIYAPDYLRGQKDKQLHGIAEMIERQVEKIQRLDEENGKLELANLELKEQIKKATDTAANSYAAGFSERNLDFSNSERLVASYREKDRKLYLELNRVIQQRDLMQKEITRLKWEVKELKVQLFVEIQKTKVKP